MHKENQSLLDFLQTMPMSSFMVHRSPISNKEAQTLYDIWSHDEKNEYGKNEIPEDSDPFQVSSLTSKGYLRNEASRYVMSGSTPTRLCEFTDKGRDVIKKIILHKENSAFEKSSSIVDYELIHRIEDKKASGSKTASSNAINTNWLGRLLLE